jgi:hypothetical protein
MAAADKLAPSSQFSWCHITQIIILSKCNLKEGLHLI